MPIYDAARVQNLQDAEARKRVSPFLAEEFDAITLDRPGFLQEVGLEPGDEALLRLGALGQEQLRHPLFWRALGEEIRTSGAPPAAFFERVPSTAPESQWLTACRIWQRWQQLMDPARCAPQVVASQLEISREDLEKRRQALSSLTPDGEVDLILAIMLQLLGVGTARAALDAAVDHQLHQRAFLFFTSDRPNLTHLENGPGEVELLRGTRMVRRSLAEHLDRSAALGAELWAQGWLKYLSTHQNLSTDEFQAIVDHLQDQDRYRWTLMVAAGNTKARRAVAAVAIAATEALATNQDTAGLQRLFGLFEDFSERYAIEGVLKRKFGATR
jgi:hypothetical protein